MYVKKASKPEPDMFNTDTGAPSPPGATTIKNACASTWGCCGSEGGCGWRMRACIGGDTNTRVPGGSGWNKYPSTRWVGVKWISKYNDTVRFKLCIPGSKQTHICDSLSGYIFLLKMFYYSKSKIHLKTVLTTSLCICCLHSKDQVLYRYSSQPVRSLTCTHTYMPACADEWGGDGGGGVVGGGRRAAKCTCIQYGELTDKSSDKLPHGEN